MTTEALDPLDQLSNPTNIKQAAQDRDRGSDRFPATHFRADILGNGSDLEVEQRKIGNSIYPTSGIWFDLDVKEVYAGKQPVGEARLWVEAPRPNDSGEQKASERSEIGLMMTVAAGVNQDHPNPGADPSISNARSLPGKKNVEFIEEVHKYIGSRKNSDGSWDNAFPRTQYYYRLNFRSGGAVANGNTSTAAAKPSDATIAKALDMIKSAGTDGIREAEFNLAASKDSVIKADKAMLGYLHSGKLVGDNPDKVLRDGEKLVWVAAE